MRKSSAFFFAIAAIVLSSIIWGGSIPQLISRLNPAASIEIPTATAPTGLDLTVDAQQLLSYVNALDRPRYSQEQKADARRNITAWLSQYGIEPTLQSYGVAETGSQITGANLIAEIPGSDPAAGEILLGAHTIRFRTRQARMIMAARSQSS